MFCTPIIIDADDAKHLELTKGINPGKEKAGEAVRAVNGFIVIPTFAPEEHSLNPRQFSDFNDLANISKLGIEGVKRQIKPKFDKITSRYTQLRHHRNQPVAN